MTQPISSFPDRDLILGSSPLPQPPSTRIGVFAHWYLVHRDEIRYLAGKANMSVPDWLQSWMATLSLPQPVAPGQAMSKPMPPVIQTFGPLRVNEVTHRSWYRGKEILLPATLFLVLVELMRTPGELVTFDTLVREVLRKPRVTIADLDNIKVKMSILRKKLGITPEGIIQTVRRHGYRLRSEEG